MSENGRFTDRDEDFDCGSTFRFSTQACHICNGYYGPCFEEHVCATCHAFLFPDVGLFDIPILSMKTDDDDSGNDEPTELYYGGERRASQQPQSVPSAPPSPPRPAATEPQIRPKLPIANEPIEALPRERLGDLARELEEYLSKKLSRYEAAVEPEDWERASSPGRLRLRNDRWEAPFRNLPDRVDMLSDPKHVEHEPVNETGLVERLPPEVLLLVFSNLDDVSLWSATKVCRRWQELLLSHVTSQQWQRHVKHRWPLYRAISRMGNWYSVYDRLASSSPCRTCLSQLALRPRLPRIEQNSWRRNRLRIELKCLRNDPFDDIRAVPLDQMCYHWHATITGPVGSPYEGGLFHLHVQVPYRFPLCPPIVRFLTRILHPNVSRHGDVGIDVIQHNWSSALTIAKVLISIQSLLTDPYCQVCMEPELGEMYTHERERFNDVARSWTWRYAMHDVVTPA